MKTNTNTRIDLQASASIKSNTAWAVSAGKALKIRTRRVCMACLSAAGAAALLGAAAVVLYAIARSNVPLQALSDPDLPEGLRKLIENTGVKSNIAELGVASVSSQQILPVFKVIGGVVGLGSIALGVFNQSMSAILMGIVLCVTPSVMDSVIGTTLDGSLGGGAIESSENNANLIQEKLAEAIRYGLPARVKELMAATKIDAQVYTPYLVAQAQSLQPRAEVQWDMFRKNMEEAISNQQAANLSFSPEIMAMLENKAWGDSRSEASRTHVKEIAAANERYGSLSDMAFMGTLIFGAIGALLFALQRKMKANLGVIARVDQS